MHDPATAPALLTVSDLHAWYNESHVLHGVSFDVRRGEVVTLLGRNGAGKSTTLRSIIGMMKKRKGSIVFDRVETIDAPSRRIASSGVGYVPEDRGIFGTLSVIENLRLPPVTGSGGLTEDEIYSLFPNLKERLQTPGKRLSGGEQQMLSIARILRTGARLVLLDEPTEGLAPAIVKEIGRVIRSMKERGLTIILVEQSLHFATQLADRHFIVEEGRVVDTFAAGEIAANQGKINRYLSL